MKILLALLAASLPTAALGQSQVALTGHIAVEKTTVGADGKAVVTMEEPKVVVPGDRLAFTLEYRNASAKPADNFVITDPLPKGVVFADHASGGAELSVDGGKSFGPLAALKVADASGAQRAAAAADVTHIRWKFARPIAAGEHGEVKFEGIVK